MKVLVIGGTRFIGAAAVERLHELGHEVAVLNRGQSPVSPPDEVQRIRGDRQDLAASRTEIEAFGPDVVLHNVVVTAAQAKQAVDLFRGMARRLVMVSSCDVYRAYARLIGTEPGKPDPIPLTEDSPLREERYPYRSQVEDPTHLLYDYDKIPAEEAVLTAEGLEGTVLRLPMVLGPNDYQHRLLPYLKPMEDGRPAIVLACEHADWSATYGDVANVAEAIALACTRDAAAGRIYNVGDWILPTRELAEAVQEAVGWEGRIVVRPAAELPEEFALDFDPRQDLACSDLRLRDELGYERRVELDETIRRTIQWERDNMPDPLPPNLTRYEAEDRVLSKRSAGSP